MAESQHKRALVIRTGCLACRAEGIRCNPTNPKCKTYSSTTWTTNQPPSPPTRRHHIKLMRGPFSNIRSLTISWQATQREQQSLYFFSTISAPELAGYMDFPFWSEVLLQTTHDDAAIMHAVAAIGASHEYKLRRQAGKENLETEGLRNFALRQVNKAIKALVQPKQGLLRALTASVLFACFESLSRGREEAVSHVVHAARILRQVKGTDEGKGMVKKGFPIPIDLIEPLVVQYECQVGLYYGDTTQPKEAYLNITQPIEIRSVSHARILLLQGISMTQDAFTQHSNDLHALQLVKNTLATWFSAWDTALTHFLSTTQKTPAINRIASLLRAHHLAAFITTTLNPIHGWAPHTPAMRTILSLLQDLHSTDPRRTTPSSQPPETPYFMSTMGMTEPLYVVASRCVDREVAEKARVLLGRLPPAEGAGTEWRVGSLEGLLGVVEGRGGG